MTVLKPKIKQPVFDPFEGSFNVQVGDWNFYKCQYLHNQGT